MKFFPDKDRYMKDSKEYNVIPVFTVMDADLETPVSLFFKTGGQSLLESVESGGNVGRYSFISIGKKLEILLKGNSYTIRRFKNEELDMDEDSGSTDNPLERVKDLLENFKTPEYEGLPPFSGGFIGYLGYETVSYFEDVPVCRVGMKDVPDGIFISPEIIIVHDILKKDVTIVVTTFPDEEKGKAYEEAVSTIRRYAEMIKGPLERSDYANIGIRGEVIEYETDLSIEDYSSAVTKCKEHIIKGDIIQAVISREITVKTNARPFDLYRKLRVLNPSPYLFFLDFGNFVLTGSSPEVMVRVHGDELLLKPIAGTRRRGRNVTEDEKAAAELLRDSKERAEHLMLVDLGRNDLGRIAEPGTVDVTDFMSIERYSHVMHIVSTIKAKLDDGYDAFDVIRACFPAGTVTGAPKIRAMEIINDLERGRRGPYGGMVFNLGFNGNLDSCITIRSMILKGDKAVIRSGAGIVADSRELNEYNETTDKAEALVEALRKTGGRI